MKNPHGAERAEKIQRAQQLLERGLRELTSSDAWKQLLERLSRCLRARLGVGRYSFANQLLLWMQRPEVTCVATFETWKRARRHVRKGEKALFILQPRPIRRRGAQDSADEDDDAVFMTYRPLPVFAVEQTDGEPLPEAPRLTGDITAPEPFVQAVERLREVVLGLQDRPVEAVELRARAASDPDALGWFNPRTRQIVVIDTGNRAQMLKTLLHETAHAVLHADGYLDVSQKEVEAESVAFVAAHALGLDTSAYSFPYVASWALKDDPTELVRESGERIQQTARLVLDALLGPITDHELASHSELVDESPPLNLRSAS